MWEVSLLQWLACCLIHQISRFSDLFLITIAKHSMWFIAVRMRGLESKLGWQQVMGLVAAPARGERGLSPPRFGLSPPQIQSKTLNFLKSGAWNMRLWGLSPLRFFSRRAQPPKNRKPGAAARWDTRQTCLLEHLVIFLFSFVQDASDLIGLIYLSMERFYHVWKYQD